MFFGPVPGGVSIVAVATLECFIGACLITARLMRAAIWLLALEFVGILAPLVLLPGRLFAGPHHAPTLEGQYVLKDVILAGAAMVIAAATFRGGRLVRDDVAPGSPAGKNPTDGEQRLRLVLEAAGDRDRITELCRLHGVSDSQFHDWQVVARAGARAALDEPALIGAR